MKRRFRILIALAMTVAAFSGPVGAQGTAGAGDSLCLHFSGDSRDLLVQLQRGMVMSGTVPLTICGLEPGATYSMTVRGRGFEIRKGYLSFDRNGVASVRGNRLGTFARNIIPGWGSIRAERKDAGWSDIISIAFAGMVTLREQNEYQHIENRHDILMGQLEAADNVEERKKIRTDANKALRDLNVQNQYRRLCLGYTAYMYAFQLIDPWIVGNPPRTRVTAGGSVVEIRGSGSSAAKAALLSLLRPGRGQFYQGKKTRGILFTIVSTAGVMIALDYKDLYEQAADAYELNLEYFDNADNIDDEEYYRERSREYWADVEKTRRWRNISYGVVAGIWAAGVIDAFIPGRDDAPLSDLSFDLGPNHASLVYRF